MSAKKRPATTACPGAKATRQRHRPGAIAGRRRHTSGANRAARRARLRCARGAGGSGGPARFASERHQPGRQVAPEGLTVGGGTPYFAADE